MKFILLFLVTVLVLPLSSQAQTTDAVLDDYFNAIGGRTAWMNVKSIIKVGRSEFFISDISKPSNLLIESINLEKASFIGYLRHSLQYRTDEFSKERTTIFSHDVDKILVRNGTDSIINASNTASGLFIFKEDYADFIFAEPLIFLDYQSKASHTIEYAGKDSLSNNTYEVLKVTIQRNGKILYFYFNTANKLLEMKLSEKSNIQKGKYYDDYRPVNQILYPFYIKEFNQVASHTSFIQYIEINSPIVTDELFDLYSETNNFTNESVRRMILLSKLKED